jgi:hypothetical protein
MDSIMTDNLATIHYSEIDRVIGTFAGLKRNRRRTTNDARVIAGRKPARATNCLHGLIGDVPFRQDRGGVPPPRRLFSTDVKNFPPRSWRFKYFHEEIHFGLAEGVVQVRCGGRGLRVIAGRIPAASDLVGIYEDVGTVLITLGTSSVLSFKFSTSVSGGSAISAIRTSPGCYPFERKIFPAGLLHVGEPPRSF